MDPAALRALIAAYRAHPEPRVLSLILESDGSEVVGLLEELTPASFADGQARLRAAELAIAGGAHGLALRLLGSSGDAKDELVRAHALLGAGDRAAARSAYERAIAANPTLEDVDLKRTLDASADGEEGRHANVVSLSGRRAERAEGERPARKGDAADLSILPSAAERRDARIRFTDVGGLDEVKGQIRRRIITPFLKPSLFDAFRRKAGGGVLLYGPPGCGKTMLARATAGECEARFIDIQIAEILDMYIGQSEKRLSAAFAEARRETPTVLFFDEIEALAARRRYGSHDASASLVSAFLSELDGFQQNNTGVLVLAATNVPWAVDAAFRRPGRFDRVLFVPPPDAEARAAILTGRLARIPGGPAIDVRRIAGLTSGFSGADLGNLVETASDLAIEESLASGEQRPLSQLHVDAALKEVKATTIEWLTTARNYAKYSNAGGQYDEVAAFLDRHSR